MTVISKIIVFVTLILILVSVSCGSQEELKHKHSRKSVEEFITHSYIEGGKEYFISHLFSALKEDSHAISSQVIAYEDFFKKNGNLISYEISAGEIFNIEQNSQLLPIASYVVKGQFQHSTIIFGISLAYENNEWLFYGFSQK